MDRWLCCEYWQRSLSNKWNAREFAAMHGVKVPELYWFGRRLSGIPFSSLPDHFVLKPFWGAAGKRNYVVSENRELLRRRQYASRRDLRDDILKECGRFSPVPYLVEEFIPTPERVYTQGVEYKCYVFGGELAATRCIQIQGYTSRALYYDPEWIPFEDPFNTLRAPLDPQPRPPNYEDLVALSREMGRSIGTFMRVDFFLSEKGCYFNEFASTPLAGRGYTPFADAYLGRFWSDHIPDKT